MQNEIKTNNWSGRVILIAEDEEINYILIKEFLKSTEIEILHAKNGREAIELFSHHTEIELILMDLKMPEIDGYEAIKLIKEINPQIPIIVQTAYSLFGDKEKALSTGADNYISKPINKNKLLELIDRYLPNEKK